MIGSPLTAIDLPAPARPVEVRHGGRRGWIAYTHGVARQTSVILALCAACGAAGCLLLWRANTRLAAERDAARAELQRRATADPRGPVPSRLLFETLGRAIERADEAVARDPGLAARGDGAAPEAKPAGEEPPPDWQERRARRQDRLRAMLGRQPGESDEAYRARVTPLVHLALATPRERMVEARRQFEEAAGLSAEQRAALDTAFTEAGATLVDLASQAVAAGELTPYSRNTRGVLAFVGAAVAPLSAVDERVRGVLTPAQQQVLDESGFDLLEYAGTHAPWESVTPPPPPPGP